MRPAIHGIALFCDDLREEIGGSTSLVGIAPDNIVVPRIPSKLPKVAIYSRIIIPIDFSPCDISVWLKYPGGREVQIGSFPANDVEEACEAARAEGNLVTGLVAEAQTTSFAINEPGRIFFALRYDDREDLIGSVRFLAAEGEAEESASDST